MIVDLGTVVPECRGIPDHRERPFPGGDVSVYPTMTGDNGTQWERVREVIGTPSQSRSAGTSA
jgi:hypothetical protein